jgi:hypothetical protein
MRTHVHALARTNVIIRMLTAPAKKYVGFFECNARRRHQRCCSVIRGFGRGSAKESSARTNLLKHFLSRAKLTAFGRRLKERPMFEHPVTERAGRRSPSYEILRRKPGHHVVLESGPY